jgi:hypothetical protein
LIEEEEEICFVYFVEAVYFHVPIKREREREEVEEERAVATGRFIIQT